MEFKATEIPEVIVVQPDVFQDQRGFFIESYNARKYEEGGIKVRFIQDNHSSSCRGTLRGLHAQNRRPQSKLLRVVKGEVFDVAVDVRRGSPTFKKWVGVRLSAENFRQIFIPSGFLHGFCVLSEEAEIEYKCDEFYDPGGEIGVRWDDPSIGVEWPVQNPILSERDRTAPRLEEIMDLLPNL